MVNINLETNPYFKDEMKNIGFKKAKNEFVKAYKDALQMIVWGHATHGEKQTRYYSCSCMIEYPVVSEIAEQFYVIVHPIGTHMGIIMQKKGFVEWELKPSFSENKIHQLLTIL